MGTQSIPWHWEGWWWTESPWLSICCVFEAMCVHQKVGFCFIQLTFLTCTLLKKTCWDTFIYHKVLHLKAYSSVFLYTQELCSLLLMCLRSGQSCGKPGYGVQTCLEPGPTLAIVILGVNQQVQKNLSFSFCACTSQVTNGLVGVVQLSSWPLLHYFYQPKRNLPESHRCLCKPQATAGSVFCCCVAMVVPVSISDPIYNGTIQYCNVLHLAIVEFLHFYLFLFVGQIYREKKRQLFSIFWFIPRMTIMAGTELLWNQEPGAFSGSPMWVQGSTDLDQPPLLSHPISEKLDWKWARWDTNWYPYKMPVLQAED